MLFCRDDVKRVRFEVETMSRWFDMERFRKVMAEGLDRRLAEGRFGR
jgi:hypothetical protein